jgi:hypothetical protein
MFNNTAAGLPINLVTLDTNMPLLLQHLKYKLMVHLHKRFVVHNIAFLAKANWKEIKIFIGIWPLYVTQSLAAT